jgi:hypothetical protein
MEQMGNSKVQIISFHPTDENHPRVANTLTFHNSEEMSNQ